MQVILNDRVVDYDGEKVSLKSGDTIQCKKVIWAAGITGNKIKGLPDEAVVRGGRIRVNRNCELIDLADVFAIGDVNAAKFFL